MYNNQVKSEQIQRNMGKMGVPELDLHPVYQFLVQARSFVIFSTVIAVALVRIGHTLKGQLYHRSVARTTLLIFTTIPFRVIGLMLKLKKYTNS